MCGREPRFPWPGLLLAILIATGCSAPFTMKGAPRQAESTDRRAVSAAFQPQRIAVTIGIDTFADPTWSRLRYATKDARDLAAILSDPATGRFDEVKQLTAPEETTKARILEALDELARKNLSPDDTVVLYVSSHGTLNRTTRGILRHYLVAHDTRMNQIEQTAIDLTWLRQRFQQLRSQKKLLIFAFCHSGQGKSQLDDSMQQALGELKGPFFVKPIDAVSEATVVLTASAWGETAREDRTLQNDIYTHFLIAAIKGQDRNGDGAVTASEAHDYAREQTYYFTKGEQRPSIESVVLGTDPIILSGRIVRRGKPVLYDYSDRHQNLELLVDGERKGVLPTGVAMEPGTYEVTVMSPQADVPLLNEMVTIRSGQQLSLPLLMDGYDQGLAVRVGYQGFLTGDVDESVAKPLVMYGLSYTDHTLLGPRVALRADVAFGQDAQTLDVGLGATSADVSQLTYGAAVYYRQPIGWAAWYAGPRLGGLYLSRELAGTTGSQSYHTISPGGIVGMNLRYKRRLSVNVESTINYANIQLSETNTNSVYYNLFGGLSVNF